MREGWEGHERGVGGATEGDLQVSEPSSSSVVSSS